jgi:hypothetical protein
METWSVIVYEGMVQPDEVGKHGPFATKDEAEAWCKKEGISLKPGRGSSRWAGIFLDPSPTQRGDA